MLTVFDGKAYAVIHTFSHFKLSYKIICLLYNQQEGLLVKKL